MFQADTIVASPKREHSQHTELQIVEASIGGINDLGILDQEPSIRRRRVAPDRASENLPEVGFGKLFGNAAGCRGHHEGPEVGTVTGFIDADDPGHAGKLS
jgi:hypothetical protein